jgi:hypothetical protein
MYKQYVIAHIDISISYPRRLRLNSSAEMMDFQ